MTGPVFAKISSRESKVIYSIVYIRKQSFAHALGGDNGVAFSFAINRRCYFSPCKLCFIGTSPFLRLIVNNLNTEIHDRISTKRNGRKIKAFSAQLFRLAFDLEVNLYFSQ